MSNIKQTLEKYGLSPNESACYLACLELGAASVQKIGKKAEVKRTTVYTILDELIKKGLITKTEQKRKTLYLAENPTYLLRREEERKQELESAVTELKAIYNTSSDKPKIKYFNGKEGIATIYNDIIKTGKNIVAFSNLDDLFNVMSGEWFTDYAKRRAARNVFFRGLTPRPSNSEQTALLNSQRQQWKILPTGNFFTELNIYDNKIALLNFRRLRGEIIEDQTFATTLKVVFENLWQSLPDKIPISNEIN